MSRIRGKDTTPEMRLRGLLWSLGLRYRLGLRVLGVRPDLVFPGTKLAIFVDGCFWHGCPEHYVRPRSDNAAFWASKLKENVERDERQTSRLEGADWRVIRIWEHELKKNTAMVADTVWDAVHKQIPACGERWAAVSVLPLSDGERELWTLRELHSGRIRQRTLARGRRSNDHRSDLCDSES
jgi:DNA mismatch endonuclease (patch repair protein)